MITLIWAMDKNRGIGINNQLPWKLKADMKRFVAVTKGKPIIMGRKTYESIGKPLPNRTNIIVTFDKNYEAEGCIIAHSIDDAIQLARNNINTEIDPEEEFIIIGGSKIYEQFLPLADKLHITIIDHEFECDSFFPEFDLSDWNEIEKQSFKADDENKYDYEFLTLIRK